MLRQGATERGRHEEHPRVLVVESDAAERAYSGSWTGPIWRAVRRLKRPIVSRPLRPTKGGTQVVSVRTQRFGRRAVVLAVALGAVLGLAGTAIAALPLTTVSTDPYTNTVKAFHQTQVEPDTFSSGSTIMSVFQSGRFTDGGASNIGYATSTNNGQTWTNGFLPG